MDKPTETEMLMADLSDEFDLDWDEMQAGMDLVAADPEFQRMNVAIQENTKNSENL